VIRHNLLAENQHLVPEAFEPFEEERHKGRIVLRYCHPDGRWCVLELCRRKHVISNRILPSRSGEVTRARFMLERFEALSCGPREG
jgi:hypothetical protein